MVKFEPVLERVGDFSLLDEPFVEDTAFVALLRAETIGRPIGDADWLGGIGKAHWTRPGTSQEGKETAKLRLSKLSP